MKGEFAQVLEVVLSGGKWTPDRIKEARPAITLSCETIGHNLRRARRAGRVDVSYYVSGRGQKVAEYFAPRVPCPEGQYKATENECFGDCPENADDNCTVPKQGAA